MIRSLPIVLLLSVSVALPMRCQDAPQPALVKAAPAKPAAAKVAPVEKTGLPALTTEDRLRIRDAQLELAQAHIARLNNEKADASRIKEAEASINTIIEMLQSEYACPDCNLATNFTWVKRPAPEAAKQGATPAKKGGQPKQGANP